MLGGPPHLDISANMKIQMANHFMIFLEKYFKLFPEYEHDEVSLNKDAKFKKTRAKIVIDFYLWRILCRPTHSLHCSSNRGPKRKNDWCEMECRRSTHR